MPEEGVQLRPKNDMLSFEEIVRLARLFAKEGVTKIRLTGGEPLIRRDLSTLVAELSKIPGIASVAITTNGLLLTKQLDDLKRAGATLFNISLDTLRENRFREITRRGGLQNVLDAIQATVDAGYRPVKVNCVVQRGVNDDELANFVELTKDGPLEIRFIEFMPFDGNAWDSQLFLSYQDMLERVKNTYPNLVRSEDDPNHTSKTWQVPGYAGKLGFISSMSDHFCSTCNRLRLTADGNLKVCLFGAAEVSLRDLMRNGHSDADLVPVIARAVGNKDASHAGMLNLAQMDNRPMILIGG